MNREAFSHYKIGILEIDDQHWHLIEMIDNIKYNNKTCRTKDDYVRLIEEIRNSILFHFEYEERLMKGIKFPFFCFHQQEHARLVDLLCNMIVELKCSSLKADLNFHIKLVQTLQTVIVEHIDHYDSQIATFLKWKSSFHQPHTES